MKGIIVAAGTGSRLYPLTVSINKQLLPVYDKPMIYYPLTTLMLAGITEILVIVAPHDRILFEGLLKDGSQWGITLQYAVQAVPRGIAEAFIIAERFVGRDSVCLILGDNIFFGDSFASFAHEFGAANKGAQIFAYYVENSQQYGVVEFDDSGKVLCLTEKPLYPKSNYAVPGIYFYDCGVSSIAKQLKPSSRGELEITDLNQAYLKNSQLQVTKLSKDTVWFDAGTIESIWQAGNFVRDLKGAGENFGCPEQAAGKMGYI